MCTRVWADVRQEHGRRYLPRSKAEPGQRSTSQPAVAQQQQASRQRGGEGNRAEGVAGGKRGRVEMGEGYMNADETLDGGWGQWDEVKKAAKAASTQSKRRPKNKKRGASTATVEELKKQARGHVANAYAPGSNKTVKTALRAFSEFDEVYKDERPEMLMRPRYYGDAKASIHNELSLILFASWLHDSGLAPSTITTYVSLVKTNLAIGLGWALTVGELELRLPRLLKGLRRMQKKTRKKRVGWRARYERMLFEAMGTPTTPEGLTQKALRCTLRAGLLRAADVLPDTTFDPELHSTLGDLIFLEKPGRGVKPTRRYARLTVLPAKKSERQGKTEHVYFPQGNGVVDAYTALWNMVCERKARFGDEPDNTPLFLLPQQTSYQTRHACALFKASGEKIGIEVAWLGAHSGRIGGATDHFSADTPAALLQNVGRWVRAPPDPDPHPATFFIPSPLCLEKAARSLPGGHDARAEGVTSHSPEEHPTYESRN